MSIVMITTSMPSKVPTGRNKAKENEENETKRNETKGKGKKSHPEFHMLDTCMLCQQE